MPFVPTPVLALASDPTPEQVEDLATLRDALLTVLDMGDVSGLAATLGRDDSEEAEEAAKTSMCRIAKILGIEHRVLNPR